MTWADYGSAVRAVAGGLTSLGVRPQQTVALMLRNRPEFHMVDAGAMHLGAVAYSLHHTYSSEEIAGVLEDAESRTVVTETAFLEPVLVACRAHQGIENLVVIDATSDSPPDGSSLRIMSLTDLTCRSEPSFDFDAAWTAVRPEDPVTLSYTSGSTGPPKAAELTHANQLAAARSLAQMFDSLWGARLISYLPMAHSVERWFTQYLAAVFGFTVTCCPDMREVIDHLPDVRPNWFFSVPLIFERLRTMLEADLAAQTSKTPRQSTSAKEVTGAVDAEQPDVGVPSGLASQNAVADRRLLASLRSRWGLDDLNALWVGTAAADRDLVGAFHALGLPLAEVWGLTEMVGVPSAHYSRPIRIGTLGHAAPGVELRLADDGEIMLRSEAVMQGYRNRPMETRRAIDVDGWLHTGDLGELDQDGFLRIAGRSKEVLVTAAGNNVSPSAVESRLRTAHPLIGHVICIGDGRPYLVALIAPDIEALRTFAREHAIADAPPHQLATHPEVQATLRDAIERANARLSSSSRVRRFAMLDSEWQAGGDELTQTMKPRRRAIETKYRTLIDGLYSDSAQATSP